MLSCRKLTQRRGPRVLLRELDATVHAGQRLGIVGRNGTGKSSLLAAIRGELGTDGGSIDLPGGITMASVAQESPSGPRSALDYVLDGDAEYRRIEQRLARAEASGDGDQLGALHERLLAIDGYAAPSRAGRLLHGLGFAPEQQDWALDRFSGGWRVRLNLAQALMCRSELLLLDEPTNHLDLDAVLWLQQWLLQYPGTLVLISHDRDFLDAVCDYILHLEHETGTVYRGGYSAFEAARAERLEQQAAQYKAQQQRLAHLQSYVDRFRAKATKARQAQSRLKQMERIEKVEPAHWDSPFSFAFAEPDRLPHPMLQLDKVDAGYGDTVILSGLKLGLGPGDRVGLLGRNGAGKSTLIKSIAGRIPTLRGHVHRDKHLQVGYFAQHALEQLDPAASPLLHLQRMGPKASDAALRNYLGGFDFRGDQALARFEQRYRSDTYQDVEAKALLLTETDDGWRILREGAPDTVDFTAAGDTAPTGDGDPARASADAVAADVRAALENWAEAWSDQNVRGYLNAYSDNFEPAGDQSRAAWAEARRERVRSPDWIRVELDDIRVTRGADGAVKARFEQHYESEGYSDRERKQVTLEREDGGWRIIRES